MLRTVYLRVAYTRKYGSVSFARAKDKIAGSDFEQLGWPVG
ncbi:MAG: hypothetical protein OEZ38_13560 [Gammaproteobacteria bacterium]|nr:hypothetical protein [Gammaproteobacteria bacterium]